MTRYPTAEDLRRLISELRGRNTYLRQNAVTVLGGIGPPKALLAVPYLRRMLEDPDPFARVNVAKAIVRLEPGDKPAIATLLELFGHRDPRVREATVTAMGELAPAATYLILSLIRALYDRSTKVRAEAAGALEAFGSAAACAVPDLIRLLDAADLGVRIRSALALEAMGAEALPALPALVRAAREWEESARSTPLHILVKLAPGHPDVVAVLGEALSSEDKEVFHEAARGLAACGSAARGALPALLNALHREYTAFPWGYVADSLANIGADAQEAIPVLEKALQHQNEFVRKQALKTLQAIRGKRMRHRLPTRRRAP